MNGVAFSRAYTHNVRKQINAIVKNRFKLMVTLHCVRKANRCALERLSRTLLRSLALSCSHFSEEEAEKMMRASITRRLRG